MFALLWIPLLCIIGCSAAAEKCVGLYCITLSEQELRAEAGLCVVIPCTFRLLTTFTPRHILWYKCNPRINSCSSDLIFYSDMNNIITRPEFTGRVSLLEPDLQKRNCSIVIKDLAESDSGSYKMRLLGQNNALTFPYLSTVKVTGLKQPTLMVPQLTEGEQSTLTCVVVPGLCSGSDPHITWIWRRFEERDAEIQGNVTFENMEVTTFKHSSTLTFNSSAEHHRTNITCRVTFTGDVTTEKSSTISVTYMKEVQIIGDASVKEGDALNLTCSVESFPPSQIKWVKKQNGAKSDLQDGGLSNPLSSKEISLQKEIESYMLFISNVTKEHSGQYVCHASNFAKTLKANVDVAVIWLSKFQNNSKCELESGVLTCVCISEGFPVPTITWPLLRSHRENYVLTTAHTNNTISSTFTLKYPNKTTVECISSNNDWETRRNLSIQIKLPLKDDHSTLQLISRPEIIIAFLVGTLFSAIICCVAIVIYRMKKKTARDSGETVELVTGDDNPQDAEERSQDSKEVNYANIDFFKLKKKSPEEAAVKHESTKTEYAEIQKEERGVREEETGNLNEDEKMMEVVKETKDCAPQKQDGEVEAVYSNVNDVMAGI